MSQKKFQRGIIHSNEKIKRLIDYRLKDITDISNRSVSDILETALLDGLFPRNKVARSIVVNYLYSDSEENGVRKTLENLFALDSDGVQLENLGTLRLLNFCRAHIVNYRKISDRDILFQRFLNQFGSLVEVIEGNANCFDNPPAMDKLRAEWARTLYNIACEKPKEMSLKYYLDVIIDNWLLLSINPITYLCLSYIVSMADYTETAEARNDLLDIIEKITVEW